MRRSATIALAGLVAGALLAGAGILLAPAAATEGFTTTPTPEPADVSDATPWWYSPLETRIGPTVIIPISLTIEEGDLVFRYEVHDLAPQAIGRMRGLEESNPFFAAPREEPVAAPERWTLQTVGGEIPGESLSARAPSARFEVPDGFVLGTITGLRLDSYRMRMPYVADVEVSTEPGIEYTLDDGASFVISRILPQATTTILQVDYVTPSDSFTSGEPTPMIISGVGLEWLSYNQRQFGGLQLIRKGPDLPDTVTLRVRSTYWVPFETDVAVDLTGVRRG